MYADAAAAEKTFVAVADIGAGYALPTTGCETFVRKIFGEEFPDGIPGTDETGEPVKVGPRACTVFVMKIFGVAPRNVGAEVAPKGDAGVTRVTVDVVVMKIFGVEGLEGAAPRTFVVKTFAGTVGGLVGAAAA